MPGARPPHAIHTTTMNDDTHATQRQETGGKPWHDQARLRGLYSEQGLSMDAIAKRFGCSPGTIAYHLKKFGIRSRSKSEACSGKNRVEYVHFRTNQGYEVWDSYDPVEKNVNTVLVHRLLAVSEHGFDAVRGCDVHHKNGVRWDNRPSNIELLTPGEHRRLHIAERGRSEGGEFA